MAQAIFNHLKKDEPLVDSNYEAISWGTGIADHINPKILKPLSAMGISVDDNAVYFPKDSDHTLVQEAIPTIARAYTMGCMKDDCELPGGLQLDGDWALDDPAKDEVNVVSVRDAIVKKSLELIQELAKEE